MPLQRPDDKATITIEYPEEIRELIEDAFAATYGRPETVTDDEGSEIPNPESKRDFARRKLVEYVFQVVGPHFERSLLVEPTDAARQARRELEDAARDHVRVRDDEEEGPER